MSTTMTPRESVGEHRPDVVETRVPVRSKPFWRRPWMIPLAVVCGIFLVYAVPRYLTFNPKLSLIPAPSNFSLHYPLLVGHVLFGSIAMITCCLQVWPWLRRRHPRVHRITGRIYVFGGVVPCSLLAGVVGLVSPSGLSNRLSSVVLATLWLTFTLTGLRMAIQRREAEHRRWMIRSFALTLSIIVSRVLGQIYTATILPPPQTGNVADLVQWGQTLAGMASWPGWIIPLLIAEWWLVERGSGARYRARAARRRAGSPADSTT